MTETPETLRLAEWRTILRLSAERRAAREERQRELELDEQFRCEQERNMTEQERDDMTAREQYIEDLGIMGPGF